MHSLTRVVVNDRAKAEGQNRQDVLRRNDFQDGKQSLLYRSAPRPSDG
jgi:hypothetical protein